MTRLAAAVVALLCFVSPAAANLARPKSLDRQDNLWRLLTAGLLPDTMEVPPPAAAELTATTEVYLNGRRCEYEDVPVTASVVRMVLAPDGRTITRVEFRTWK
jgi:hypothetical protein